MWKAEPSEARRRRRKKLALKKAHSYKKLGVTDAPASPLLRRVCTGSMLLREETIHGFICKFYDSGVVKVGTAADRFTIRVPDGESSWVATRLRAELIERELATAEELPMDEDGEAAMAASNTAKLQAADLAAASKVAREAESKRARLEAALDAAKHHEETAGLKRERAELKLQLAEGHHKMATTKVKVATGPCLRHYRGTAFSLHSAMWQP